MKELSGEKTKEFLIRLGDSSEYKKRPFVEVRRRVGVDRGAHKS